MRVWFSRVNPVFWSGLSSSGGVLGRDLVKWGAALLVASGLQVGSAQAREPVPSSSTSVSSVSGQVALVNLPVEAQATHQRILKGGPFPYAKDGIVFRNRERLLPLKAREHYREYTVRTPGVAGRGARRIVCGGKPPSAPEACYYTEDHYSSFRHIQP